MTRTWKMFTCLGTEVKVHWSVLIPFAMVCTVPKSLLFMTIIFVTILLHEYGHILACRMFGNDCKKVVLSFLGGAAYLDKESEKPLEEFVVAIAGPLVNLWLIGVSLLWAGKVEFWSLVFFANLFIVVFNMVPAYPMDGGRVLRAAIWSFTSQRTATKSCAVLSVALGLVGLCLGLAYGMVAAVLVSVAVGGLALHELFGKKVDTAPEV